MRKLIGVMVVCVVALSGGWTALAAQDPGEDGMLTAPLYVSMCYDCAGEQLCAWGTICGSVKVAATVDGRLLVEVSVERGLPNSTYDVWVNQPCPCALNGGPAAPQGLTTDNQGDGDASVEVQRVECPCAEVSGVWVAVTNDCQALWSTVVVL